MIEQEGPVFLPATLQELLAQFHTALPVIVVFGCKTAFHLGDLRSHITAKKHLIFSIIYQKT